MSRGPSVATLDTVVRTVERYRRDWSFEKAFSEEHEFEYRDGNCDQCKTIVHKPFHQSVGPFVPILHVVMGAVCPTFCGIEIVAQCQPSS